MARRPAPTSSPSRRTRSHGGVADRHGSGHHRSRCAASGTGVAALGRSSGPGRSRRTSPPDRGRGRRWPGGLVRPGPLLEAAATITAIDEVPFRPLAQRSVVVAADGTSLGVVHAGENRRLVPLGAVPWMVQRLVAVAEDRRFYEHDGYDQAAMVRAGRANALSQGVTQGASTITQQLVKHDLVGDDRSPVRKIRQLCSRSLSSGSRPSRS